MIYKGQREIGLVVLIPVIFREKFDLLSLNGVNKVHTLNLSVIKW